MNQQNLYLATPYENQTKQIRTTYDNEYIYDNDDWYTIDEDLFQYDFYDYFPSSTQHIYHIIVDKLKQMKIDKRIAYQIILHVDDNNQKCEHGFLYHQSSKCCVKNFCTIYIINNY